MLRLKEDPQEEPEEEPKEDKPKEEPKEAHQIDFDFGLWDEEENMSELIFPYQEVGSPYPPPPVSPNTEPEMDITGDHAQRRDLRKMTNWAHGFSEAMLRIGAVGDRPSEVTDVLAVYGESQPPKPLKLIRTMLEDLGQLMLEELLHRKYTDVFEKKRKCAHVVAFQCKSDSLKQHEDYDDNKILPSNQNSKNRAGTLDFDSEGDDIVVYNNRFHELALICPDLVTPKKKKIERYIQGLPKKIKANVTSSKPTILHDAINMARELVEQAIQGKAARIGKSNKRKWEDHQRNTNNNNNSNNNNRNLNFNNQHQQQNKRQAAARAYAATQLEGRGYVGNLPWCNHCNSHHNGQCPPKFQRCQRDGHQEKDCRVRIPNVGVNSLQNVTCFGTENPQQNPNVVTGMFLLNDHYASILFDSSTEKSFVSTVFTPFIDIAPAALDTSNEVELADGKKLETASQITPDTITTISKMTSQDLKTTSDCRFDVFFRNKLLVFQQHQDESLYHSWTRFKDIIRKVPNHGHSIWTLIEIFLKHRDSLSCHIINLIAEGDLRKFSDIEAWVQVPRCMAWLNYYEHVDSLSTMDNEVGVTIPESTIQTLPSFEEYTPPVTYPEEVKKNLGTPIEVEPLNKIKLEEVGLNCNHNTPLSSREVPSFDKPKPQPQPLPNCPPLDASLGTERGLKPPIKPQSPYTFRMKVLDNLTIHTPPSSLVASFHLRGLYCYYRPCIGDPKKHYGFKPGLLGHSGSLGVDFLNMEMIENYWELESIKVSFLGRGLNSPVRPKEVEKVIFDEKKLGSS
ncbi:hypothetical protein Tco_0567736 [Tanacetum coccineum]